MKPFPFFSDKCFFLGGVKEGHSRKAVLMKIKSMPALDVEMKSMYSD